jgi:hypothetical protein
MCDILVRFERDQVVYHHGMTILYGGYYVPVNQSNKGNGRRRRNRGKGRVDDYLADSSHT